MSTDKELILLKLADLFIANYGYARIDVRNIAHEIWLSHATRNEYNLIRLSLVTGFESRNILERTHQIKAAIENVLQKTPSFLDLEVDLEGSDETVTQEGTHVLLSPEAENLPILRIFPDLKSIFAQSDDPQKELKLLNDKLRKVPVAKKPGSFLDTLKQMPKATLGVAILCTVISLTLQVFQWTGNDIFAAAILMGAYYKTFILAGAEYWRFLTAGFIHIDLFHLAMNLMALFNLGNFMERLYGPRKFLVTLLSGITVGSFFVYAAEGNSLVIGLSGGLYALLGVMLVYLVETGLIQQPVIRSQIFRLILINLLINFLPQISVLGHLGGLITGALLGLHYSKNKAWETPRKHAFNALILLILALGAVSTQNTKHTPLYIQTDIWTTELADRLNLGWYADHMRSALTRYYTEVSNETN